MSVKNNSVSTSVVFRGTWNAATNSPTIVSSVGRAGDYYLVSVAGTTNIDGINTWNVGDQIIFSGSVYQRVPNVGISVQSVSLNNGPAQTGNAVLTQANSDWSAASGVSQILNKPNLVKVATSGSYTDLINQPTIPSGSVSLTTNGVGGSSTISGNQQTGYTINIPNYQSQYTLPTADAQTKGGVKIGSGVDVQSDGTISVTKVSSFNNRSGVVQLSSADITNALGGLVPGKVNSVTGNIVNNTDSANPVINQQSSDWNSTTSPTQIQNKPIIPSGNLSLTTDGPLPVLVGSPQSGYLLNVPRPVDPSSVARAVYSLDLSGQSASVQSTSTIWRFDFTQQFVPAVFGSFGIAQSTGIVSNYAVSTFKFSNNVLFSFSPGPSSQLSIASYSTNNGVTWKTLANNYLNNVEYFSSTYIFTTSVAGNQYYTATSSLTSVVARNLPFSASMLSMASGGGRLLMSVQDIQTNIPYIIWTTDPTSFPVANKISLPDNYSVKQLAFGNNIFVADGKYYSTDFGNTWLATSNGPSLGTQIKSLQYVNINGVSKFIATTANNSGSLGFFESTNAIAWRYVVISTSTTAIITSFGSASGSLVFTVQSGTQNFTAYETRDTISFYQRAIPSSAAIVAGNSDKFVLQNSYTQSQIYFVAPNIFTINLPAQNNSAGAKIYDEQSITFTPLPNATVAQNISALQTLIGNARNTYSFSSSSTSLTVNTNAIDAMNSSISILSNSGLPNGSLTVTVIASGTGGTAVYDKITITDPFDNSSFSYNIPTGATNPQIGAALCVNESLSNLWVYVGGVTNETTRIFFERIIPGPSQEIIVSVTKTSASTLSASVGVISNGDTSQAQQLGFIGTVVSSFNGRIGEVELTNQDISNALGYSPVTSVTGNIVDLSSPTNPVINQQSSDWSSTTSPTQILNKPVIPAAQVQSNWGQQNSASIDFIQNKPIIPAPQVNSDWSATGGVSQILNKPNAFTPVLPTATSIGGVRANTGTSTQFVKGINAADGSLIFATPAGGGTGTVNSVTGNIVNNTDPTNPIITQVNSDWNASSGNVGFIQNKPTIPAAQQSSDWNSTVSPTQILNKPILSAVATTGNYADLSNRPTIPAAQQSSDWSSTTSPTQILNKPIIPAPQVNSDWSSTSGITQILNKPNLATVATSGSYTDLSNRPNPYNLPAAQNSVLGGIQTGVSQIGQFVSGFDSNGVAQYATPAGSGGSGGTRGVVALDFSGSVPASVGDEIITFTFSNDFEIKNNGAQWSVSNVSSGSFLGFYYDSTLATPTIFGVRNLDGVWASTDNGVNWSSRSTLRNSFQNITKSGNNLLVGDSNRGVWYSSDNGVTFTQATGIDGLCNSLLAISGNNVVASVSGSSIGIYYSTNNGLNWTKANAIANITVGQFALAPDGTIYAAAQGNGVVKSTNNGISWTATNRTSTTKAICVTPDGTIIAGSGTGFGIEYSTNGGVTWTSSRSTGTFNYMHYTGTSVLAADNGSGVLRSADLGRTWVSTSLTSGVTYAFAQTNNAIVVGGNNIGVLRSTDGGSFVLSLFTHSTYPTQNISFIPPVGTSISSAITLLSSVISAARPTYTFTTSSNSLVVDTNSASNIGDIVLSRAQVIAGSLTLSIQQGGDTGNALTVISITDPRNGSVYQYSPAALATASEVANYMALNETLTGYWFYIGGSSTSVTRLLLESTITGSLSGNQPTVSITNAGTLTIVAKAIVSGS